MFFARLLRLFFHHLYHELAFIYDQVAWLVSFGQWIEWTRTILPHVQGTRLLELGHGPGHIQCILRNQTKAPHLGASFPSDLPLILGVDESPQMGSVARRRLSRSGHAPANLVRGLGQYLPFPAQTFDCLIATFPAEFIFEAQTLSEANRTLKNGGRLVVLPAAWPRNRFLQWLYRITGESPAEALEIVKQKLIQPFLRAGFQASAEYVEAKSGLLLLVIAEKTRET